MASPMPARSATGLRAPGAISPAARWRAMPESTTSAHPHSAATTIRARDYSIPHRTTRTTWITIRTDLTATATAIPPDLSCFAKRSGHPVGWPFLLGPATGSDHDDLGADADAAIEIDHIVVAHRDAARRYVGADGPGLVGAVDAVERRAQIHRARAGRILR